MAIIKSNRDMFPSFSNLFDDYFKNELGDWRQDNFSSTNTTLPKVNITEDVNGFVVEMAAPGMNKGDFNLQLDQNVLTISSEKSEDRKDENKRYTKQEFAYQSFQRSFTLPESANAEKINAVYENGILEVKIPKKEEAKPKPPKSIIIS